MMFQTHSKCLKGSSRLSISFHKLKRQIVVFRDVSWRNWGNAKIADYLIGWRPSANQRSARSRLVVWDTERRLTFSWTRFEMKLPHDWLLNELFLTGFPHCIANQKVFDSTIRDTDFWNARVHNQSGVEEKKWRPVLELPFHWSPLSCQEPVPHFKVTVVGDVIKMKWFLCPSYDFP